MKRIFLMVVAAFFLVGCNKEYYGKCEQVYDHHTLPALDWNDYNDCDVVSINFTYVYRWGDKRYLNRYPNPYIDNEGDTIKIKGFIKHSYNEPIYYESECYSFRMEKDSLKAMDVTNHYGGYLLVEGTDRSIIENVDITKKCYITAVITFQQLSSWICSPPHPKECFAMTPTFRVVKIKN